MTSAGQFELDWTGTDPITCIQFGPGASTRLAIASWDRHVYVFDIAGIENGSGGRLITKYKHQASVLATSWGDDDNILFTGGLDCDVRRFDLNTGESDVLSTHDAPVKSLAYSLEHQLLISGSWDCTLKLHHPYNTALTPSTLPIPDKAYNLVLSPTKIIVAMAKRLIHVYDITALSVLASQSSQPPPNMIEIEPFQTRESSLKFMTRTIAAMPDDLGFATSSIEGRVAVDFFDPSPEAQAKKYAFKCHRSPDPADEDTDLVWPVHALVFHPNQGTFASGGGEGMVNIWDLARKRRTKVLGPYESGVVALDFSSDEKWLAVGISPSLEVGRKDKLAEGKIRVSLRQVPEGAWKTKEK